MHVTKRVDLALLGTELSTAGIPYAGLSYVPTGPAPDEGEVLTGDAGGQLVDLPPAAAPVVDAHVAPPRVTEFVGQQSVDAMLRTTDGAAHEIYRFSCAQPRLYTANLTIMGVDAGNFVSKSLEGRFTWKRPSTAAVMVGIVMVSDIHDTAAAAWAPNAVPSGTDIVFTVAGAAGRTIDWVLAGVVSGFAPAGLAT
jgi:hypothetical protein